MKLTYITLFPEVYTSFCETSLIKKAVEKWILQLSFVNPRDFTYDKHNQVDDEIYGWGAGMLLKAQPMIDAVCSVIEDNNLQVWWNWKIFFMSPSHTIFNQHIAYEYSNLDHIIFVSGRYEWIDYRFQQYCTTQYPENFMLLSLWQFVTLGGEIPSMVITEAITRLIPWVIKEEASHLIESYDPNQNMQNIEYPQYTRPEEVAWMSVPEVLLSWHHAEIQKWREQNSIIL